VFGDFIIAADISMGMGLSITSKLHGGLILRWWLCGAVTQWSEHLRLKHEALGLIRVGYPVLFFFLSVQLAY
jgi:hypothetical protein